MALLDPRTWFRRSTSTALALRADTSVSPPARRDLNGRHAYAVRDLARDADLAKADAALQRCLTGDVRDYIDLAKGTVRRDARLGAVCFKRVGAMQGRLWALKPPPGLEADPVALDNCAFVTRQLNEIHGFAGLLGHLGQAVIEGHAALQHGWYTNARGETATQPKAVHPRLFGWNVDTGEAGVYLGSGWTGTLTPLCDLPHEFVFHNPVAGQPDDPWLRGAIRSRILPSITKRSGTRWWLKALERWGQPQVVLEKGSDDASENGEDNDAEYIAALRAMGSDWRMVVPAGTKVTPLPVDLKSDLHKMWVDQCNADDAIRILGQNLSTEVSGGSFAAARAHTWVLATILEGDVSELAETITDGLVEAIIRFNRPGTPVPYLYINPAPIAEITPADFALRDADGRAIFDGDEFRASKGYDARPAESAPVASSPAPIADVIKAIELGRGVGIQPTKDSVAALLAGLGLVTEPIPDGAPEPKALASAAASEAAATAPVLTEAEPAVSSTPIEVGAIWTDTEDGHRLEVTAVEDGRVYFVDLDAPNPARQYSWAKASFRERARPPKPSE